MQQQSELSKMMQGDLFGSPMRVQDVDGKPVVCVADISAILGGPVPEAMLRNVPERHKLMRTMFASGQNRKAWFVTEAGLYRILLRSRSPEAERFTDWVTEEVLPSIRNTGLYAGEVATLPSTLITASEYMRLRGITGSVSGFGLTAAAVCRHSGFERSINKWGKNNRFQVVALDKAAESRTCLRGPLCERSSAITFLYKKAVAS